MFAFLYLFFMVESKVMLPNMDHILFWGFRTSPKHPFDLKIGLRRSGK